MDTQVIVVGAGPVGLMLAGELRLGGAEVVVLERLAAPTTESRASTLHARTMEILDERGLLDRLGTPPTEPIGHFGGVPLDLSRLPTRYPGQWKVPQTRLEPLLGEWAQGLGARVLRRHVVVAVAQSEEAVRVRVTGPGGPAELTAQYLVGCDGEDSTVRRLAGFTMAGTDATREMLRADVAGIDIRNRRFERMPDGLAIAARRPDGVTRVMVAEYDRLAQPRSGAPGFDEVCKAWLRVTGEDISHGNPLWLNAFDNTNRLADRYRDGRILLAGDAAHRQMPIGGQALNLGLQDAVNLGWKLAAQVCGRAPAGLLDTYHEERHEIGARVLRNIACQANLLLGGPEVERARELVVDMAPEPTLRTLLSGAITGLDVRYGRGAHPLVGGRLPHVPVGAGTAAALLRQGHGVLLDLAEDAARSRELAGIASRYPSVDLVCATVPTPGPLDGLDTVLVRPDGYVAWTSAQVEDPRAALDRWFGHIA